MQVKYIFKTSNIYSNSSFFRRRSYALNNRIYQDTTNPSQNENIFHSVNHLTIRGNIAKKNDFIDFPYVTELTLIDYSNSSLHSISTILDRMIPLTKLYRLSINCEHFCVSQLMDLLYFSPNIQILISNSISFRKISLNAIQQTQTFQIISKENKIRNVTLNGQSTLGNIELFVKLCPHLQQLTIDLGQRNFFTVIMLLERETCSYHGPFLYLLNANQALLNTNRLKLSSDYAMKSISQNLYLWS